MTEFSLIYKYLDDLFPTSLSCDWDNDGLMCVTDANKNISRILLTLDITEKSIDYAIENKYDLIISHHPLVFSPVRRVCVDDRVGRKLIKLIKNDLPAISFHTRLDAANDGVNDALASALGLRNVQAFGNTGDAVGRIGTVDEIDLPTFTRMVKDRLGAGSITVSDCGMTVNRVAVLGGAGKDYADAAKAAGADTYVTGEMGYNALLDRSGEMNIILAGHYFTEVPVLDKLKELLLKLDKDLCFGFFDCDCEDFY